MAARQDMTLDLIASRTKLHIFDTEERLTLCGLKWHESFMRPIERIITDNSKLCKKCFPGEKG